MNNSGPSIEPWRMPNDTYCSRNRSIVAWNISFIGLRPVSMRPVYGRSQVQFLSLTQFFHCYVLVTVDHITYHDYCCFPLLQNWFAFSNLHKPFFTEHGYIPFPNKNPPLDEMNNAYCKVRIALNKITLSLTTDYTLFTTGLFEVDVCSGSFNLLGNVFFLHIRGKQMQIND